MWTYKGVTMAKDMNKSSESSSENLHCSKIKMKAMSSMMQHCQQVDKPALQ